MKKLLVMLITIAVFFSSTTNLFADSSQSEVADEEQKILKKIGDVTVEETVINGVTVGRVLDSTNSLSPEQQALFEKEQQAITEYIIAIDSQQANGDVGINVVPVPDPYMRPLSVDYNEWVHKQHGFLELAFIGLANKLADWGGKFFKANKKTRDKVRNWATGVTASLMLTLEPDYTTDRLVEWYSSAHGTTVRQLYTTIYTDASRQRVKDVRLSAVFYQGRYDEYKGKWELYI